MGWGVKGEGGACAACKGDKQSCGFYLPPNQYWHFLPVNTLCWKWSWKVLFFMCFWDLREHLEPEMSRHISRKRHWLCPLAGGRLYCSLHIFFTVNTSLFCSNVPRALQFIVLSHCGFSSWSKSCWAQGLRGQQRLGDMSVREACCLCICSRDQCPQWARWGKCGAVGKSWVQPLSVGSVKFKLQGSIWAMTEVTHYSRSTPTPFLMTVMVVVIPLLFWFESPVFPKCRFTLFWICFACFGCCLSHLTGFRVVCLGVPLYWSVWLHLQAFDDCIFAFFAVEMVIKMMALGIFGSECYLGDTWNRLDFFIVMAGWETLNLLLNFFPILVKWITNNTCKKY